MGTRKTYTFTRAILSDLPMLAQWQSHDHVARWWDASPPFNAAELAQGIITPWIVAYEARPFAYMQDYSAHAFPDHHFNNLPVGARAVDQFIADADMLGIGHGSGFMAQHLQTLFDQGAPIIATDPHPDNALAIHVYQKLGFQIMGKPQMTRSGRIVPMHMIAPN